MDTPSRTPVPNTDSTVRLADYRPPAWRVPRVELVLHLGIDESLVRSRLTLARDREEPLRLDGEGLELVEARLDGRKLDRQDYTLDAQGLALPGARDGSVLELAVRIDPARNSQLSGLYLSGSREHGFLLTQCEAQGFRRITFSPDRPDVLARYDVTLIADKARFPVLLAGGEEVESGELPDGRHFARFVDPHPKPSYLFALVAGRLEKIEQPYCTADGRAATRDALGRARLRPQLRPAGVQRGRDPRLQHGRDGEQGPQHLQQQIPARGPGHHHRRRVSPHRSGDRTRILPQLERQPRHLPRLVPVVVEGRLHGVPRTLVLRSDALGGPEAHRGRVVAASRAISRRRGATLASRAPGRVPGDRQLRSE